MLESYSFSNLKLRLLLIEKTVNELRFLKESRSLKFVAHVSMTKRVFHFPKKDRKNCLNNNLEKQTLCSGYYTVASGYEFYVRVTRYFQWQDIVSCHRNTYFISPN